MDADDEGTVPAPRLDDVVRLHQGLVVLAAALLGASALGVVFAVGDVGRAHEAGVAGPGLLVWLARLVTGAVAWLALCPVLLAVPRLLGLPEGDRERRWATGVLWGAALVGATLAVVAVLGFALAFLPDSGPFTEGRVPATEHASILGTALVSAAAAALAFTALGRDA